MQELVRLWGPGTLSQQQAACLPRLLCHCHVHMLQWMRQQRKQKTASRLLEAATAVGTDQELEGVQGLVCYIAVHVKELGEW